MRRYEKFTPSELKSSQFRVRVEIFVWGIVIGLIYWYSPEFVAPTTGVVLVLAVSAILARVVFLFVRSMMIAKADLKSSQSSPVERSDEH